MHWADKSSHGICVIIAFFVILTWFASTLRINNATKDALFAMYA